MTRSNRSRQLSATSPGELLAVDTQMNPRHAPTAAGPELPRRRDDDGSPFA
eukprot:COSAG04_NODE_26915_length_289_cov_0.778947_1_plen_50_part_01